MALWGGEHCVGILQYANADCNCLVQVPVNPLVC